MTNDARPDALSALRLLDDPIRRRLYDWVAAQREPAGREQAARETGVSRSLAAFHLEKLTDAGLLEASYRRLTGRVGPGAGRPARVYWRSDREFSVSVPERRYRTAADLFAVALERIGTGESPPTLEAAAREMGGRLGRSHRRGTSRARLVRALEEGGYEPVSDRTTIRLRNCPFDAIAEAHRSLVCSTNLAVARGIVDGAAATGYEPALDPRPGSCCVVFRRAAG